MAQIIRIDDTTWSIEDSFVRFFLLEGENGAALIDCGASCKDARKIAQGLTDKRIILLCTHSDPDHISGADAFDEIHMHCADYDERRMSSALIPLCDNDVIDLGNRRLRVIHIPGHTYGSLAFLDESRRTFYAGDSVQKGAIYMFGERRDLESFSSSLERIIALEDEFDRIISSHDQMILDKDHARRVRDAWISVLDGHVPYETRQLFGKTIRSYQTDACTFYLEGEEK